MDVNSWSWVSFVNALSPGTQSPTTVPDEDNEKQSNSSVSTGTIVGPVVGGVAGLAIIAGIIAFFLIRRRKNREFEEEKNKYSSDRMLPDESECKHLLVYMCSKPNLSIFS